MFTPNKEYTRDEIHAQLGGGTATYLPTKSGVVVAACLTPEKNPKGQKSFCAAQAQGSQQPASCSPISAPPYRSSSSATPIGGSMLGFIGLSPRTRLDRGSRR